MCFVFLWLYNLFVDSCDLFNHILQDCFTSTGAIVNGAIVKIAPFTIAPVPVKQSWRIWVQSTGSNITWGHSMWLPTGLHRPDGCRCPATSSAPKPLATITMTQMWSQMSYESYYAVYDIVLSCPFVYQSLHPSYIQRLITLWSFGTFPAKVHIRLTSNLVGVLVLGLPRHDELLISRKLIYFKLNTTIHHGCSQAWLTFGHILLNLSFPGQLNNRAVSAYFQANGSSHWLKTC